MSYDGTGTGILGKSSGRLGRFGLARIPTTSGAATIPCPYVPFRPMESDAATAGLGSTDSYMLTQTPTLDTEYRLMVPASDDAPLPQAVLTDTAPANLPVLDSQCSFAPAEADDASQAPGPVADTVPAREPSASDGADSRDQTLPISDSVPARDQPDADTANLKKCQCS